MTVIIESRDWSRIGLKGVLVRLCPTVSVVSWSRGHVVTWSRGAERFVTCRSPEHAHRGRKLLREPAAEEDVPLTRQYAAVRLHGDAAHRCGPRHHPGEHCASLA